MASNPYVEILDKQISAASNAMQSMLKANQAVYESFQTQVNKIVAQNTDAISVSLESYMKTLQQDSAALFESIRSQMENAKGP